MPAGCRSRTGRARRALLFSLLAGLAGCASLDRPPPDQISGRLVIQVASHGTQRARGVSVGFELTGNDRSGELRLSNPLGMQVAAARWIPGRAQLVTPQAESTFDTLDALAREALGEPVPLQALPDWLRGRAWPGAPAQPTDSGFDQLGWSVDLSQWAAGLMAATRRAAPTVTLRVRLEQPT